MSTTTARATGSDLGDRYQSSLHDTRVAAALGSALGITFTVCFATGLLSHLIQHPPGWFAWPARPAGLYRVTQGTHIATGLASIPLLIAKLWAVAPRFWARPAVPNLAKGVERAMLFPLVGGSLFLLVTGTLNTFQWYPWGFFFTNAHYWAAWITIGGLVGHIGAKASVTWGALRRGDRSGGELDGRAGTGQRRWFLGGVAFGSVALTVATVGQTLGPFRRLSVLAPRDPQVGPQGLPVNKTARSAGIRASAVDASYRLRIRGRVGTPVELTLAELQAMAQHSATLPIACVEGWSASARWTGVRLADVLARAGAAEGADVEVGSIQGGGRFRASTVTASVAADPDTLLALRLDGDELALDHGYPVRLIAPNRPGVFQTKWVEELIVR
ncbi:molybdopterin-dependent oxidoreductase [soil metagenome]